MERLFIYVFLGLVLFAGVLFLILRRFVAEDTEERNFTPGNANDDTGYIESAPREVAAYEERQSSLAVIIIKKAPKTIMTLIILQICTSLLTGYFTVTNSERIAKAGADVAQGDYGGAISALFTAAKPEMLEQSRLATGKHVYLDENNLFGFVYIGELDGKKVAIMDHLYSLWDHDKTLKKDDKSRNNILKGQSVSKAKTLCKDTYNAQLISREEWKLSRSHFLVARNAKEFPDIPEWTRNVSNSDNNDYYVIPKDSGIWEHAVDNDFDIEEGGFIDNGYMVALNSGGFRCSITWE